MSTKRCSKHFGNVAYVRVPKDTPYATNVFYKYDNQQKLSSKHLKCCIHTTNMQVSKHVPFTSRRLSSTRLFSKYLKTCTLLVYKSRRTHPKQPKICKSATLIDIAKKIPLHMTFALIHQQEAGPFAHKIKTLNRHFKTCVL